MFKKFRPIEKKETKSAEISTIEEQKQEEQSEELNQSKRR